MNKSLLILPILILSLTSFSKLFGQVQYKGELIKLSGRIVCVDSAMMPLSDVSIYNKNRGWGTISDKQGYFTINMGRTDTIYFSTIQHMEVKYFIDSLSVFEDRFIEIPMKVDTVWLNTINIIGLKSWNSFKQELLSLNLPDNDISLALPVIEKYASQYASGKPSTLTGPLTYLYRKFNRQEQQKRKWESWIKY